MIETPRLRLRRVRVEDVDALARAFTDPQVMRYVGAGRPLSRDEVAAMVERIEHRFEADGFGQLTRRDRNRLDARPRLLGTGLRLRGRSAVIERARTELALKRLVSIIQLGNEASIRLAQKLGAHHERDIVTSFGKPAHLYAMNLAGRHPAPAETARRG